MNFSFNQMTQAKRLSLCLCGMPATIMVAGASQPNVIIIYADDLGWGDVGYHGFSDIHTPHIDLLAQGGTTFSQGYVSASVSGPSRAGLLSGCFQARFGFYGNSPKCYIPQEHPLLPEMMKKNGYTTCMVGKWHGDPHEEYSPRRGFDQFYGIYGGHDYFESGFNPQSKRTKEKPIWINDKMEQKTLQEQNDYLTDRFTDRATAFIQSQKENPFFLYLAYNAVHHPWQAPQKYVDQLNKLQVHHEDRRIFAAMVLALDAGVGRLIETLKQEGKYENTLIFFVSDNGSPRGQGVAKPNNDPFKERGKTIMSSPGPLRGFKGDVYEGGIRVPFIVHWPESIPAGKSYQHPVINLDIYPTILAAIGADYDIEKYDGVNILPYLREERKGRPHEILYWRRDDDFAVRKGDWKLSYNDQGNTRTLELFDLAHDPYEYQNLIDIYPNKANDLLHVFDHWDVQLPPYPYRADPPNRNKTGKKRTVEEFLQLLEKHTSKKITQSKKNKRR